MSYLLNLRKWVGQKPLIAVGADVLVLESESILLQRRLDDGLWSLPGGSMEPGESLEQTARRELHEETGLVAGELRLLTVCSGPEFFHRYPNGDEIYNVTALFLAMSVSGEPRMNIHEGTALAFHSLHALPPMPATTARMLTAARAFLG